MRRFRFCGLAAWAMVAVLLLLNACSEEGIPNRIVLQHETVSATNSGQFFAIESSERWEIQVDYPYGVTPWCTISPLQGEGTLRDIQLYHKKNTSTEPRNLLIRVIFESEVISVMFVQEGAEAVDPGTDDPGTDDPGTDDPNQDELVSDAVQAWMELPQVEVGTMQAFVAHRFESNDFSARNYSMLYDATNRVALWVAYPLCADYMGSSGRSDDWGFDPKIPKQYQPNLYRGFSGGFDRGHQLTSADRSQSRSLNRTTFYFTNMTPQRGALNQRAWADLEGRVRGYTSSCDTLYVVTGAVLAAEGDASREYAKDNDGNDVAVPKAYYKVLLKYNVASNHYSSIGFWFEHREYGNTVTISETQTVREIEERTGFNFFANLPASVAEEVETEYNPGAWGF